MKKNSEAEFLKTTRPLLERSQEEIEKWETPLEKLEDAEEAEDDELERATRQLERWESIAEALEEIEELIQEKV